MYKSRLQELCQRHQWSLPNYLSSKVGPDHNPRFKASVTVNGVPFYSPDFCKSSKEAQNEAARIAFNHHTTPDPTRTTVVGDAHGDMLHLYKNRLLNYAQRKNLRLPSYSITHKGPPHDIRFRATVMIDGRTFEDPQFFRTIEEAEHAAAKVALMSLSDDGSSEEDGATLYKNLLQEFCVKEGLPVPFIKIDHFGESHNPTFISSFELGHRTLEGLAARTKKQAEMNAAKVAYYCLKKRQRLNRLEFP